MLNVEMLHNELRKITINPEQWDQGLWIKDVMGKFEEDPNAAENTACGTYGCLAGNVLLHNNVPIRWEFEPFERVNEYYNDTLTEDEKKTLKGRWRFAGTADGRHVKEAAEELLGLNRYQADVFFDGDNDLDKLWELAEKVSLGEIGEYEYRAAKMDAAHERLRLANAAVSKLTDDDWNKVRVVEEQTAAREAYESARNAW